MEQVANAVKYDVRGSQSRILRLIHFDREALLHMLFYRAAVFISILLAASIIIGMAYYSTAFTWSTKTLIVAVWILFTPQLFETFKAASIIASGGIAFGRLNQSFLNSRSKTAWKEPLFAVLKVAPYAVLAAWAMGFVALLYMWFV
jgi:hypothetical protein